MYTPPWQACRPQLKVLHTLGDPYGLALRPQTEEIETQLELAMPEEEVTESHKTCYKWSGTLSQFWTKPNGTLIAMMDEHGRSLLPCGTGSRTVHQDSS